MLWRWRRARQLSRMRHEGVAEAAPFPEPPAPHTIAPPRDDEHGPRP